MPTRDLPPHPDLAHLKRQARDLRKAHGAHLRAAYQRVREFHPRFAGASDDTIAAAPLTLGDALLVIAREHGYPSWPQLKAYLEGAERDDAARPHHERIKDPLFRMAVDLLDAGDTAGLRAHLGAHPDIIRRRVAFRGGNYFRNPTLLQFSAENPVRHGRLPTRIADAVRVILEAGAKDDRPSLDETLGLVSTGRVPRECGVQAALIDLLCDYGADPQTALIPALAHGEFAAAEALMRRGARVDLAAAAALGRTQDVRRLLPAASAGDRHRALALSAQHGRTEIVALLLDAGEDPNRYNPVGLHAHATPLHEAASYGHAQVARLLVARGADRGMRDVLFQATPAEWARYAGHDELAAYLASADGSPNEAS